jgi:hypothetical protein
MVHLPFVDVSRYKSPKIGSGPVGGRITGGERLGNLLVERRLVDNWCRESVLIGFAIVFPQNNMIIGRHDYLRTL